MSTPLIEFVIRKREERRAAFQRIKDNKKYKELEKKKAKEEDRRRRKDKERERFKEKKYQKEKDSERTDDSEKEKEKAPPPSPIKVSKMKAQEMLSWVNSSAFCVNQKLDLIKTMGLRRNEISFHL